MHIVKSVKIRETDNKRRVSDVYNTQINIKL